MGIPIHTNATDIANVEAMVKQLYGAFAAKMRRTSFDNSPFDDEIVDQINNSLETVLQLAVFILSQLVARHPDLAPRTDTYRQILRVIEENEKTFTRDARTDGGFEMLRELCPDILAAVEVAGGDAESV
ncbi:hypothetical protein MBLNU230_g1391t1 [Neophaeotheca triangularis]